MLLQHDLYACFALTIDSKKKKPAIVLISDHMFRTKFAKNRHARYYQYRMIVRRKCELGIAIVRHQNFSSCLSGGT